MAPTLGMLLNNNPKVAAAIMWQDKPGSLTNAWAPPKPSNKVGYPQWTANQKADLDQAFNAACGWFASGAHQVQMYPNGVTDQPVNVNPNVVDPKLSAMQSVSPTYMWNLYIAHVGFSLAVAFAGQFPFGIQVPWGISRYTNEQLRYLFDSTTMAWNICGSYYSMGTYATYVPGLRRDNLPKTAFALPAWTYWFLMQAGLVGSTRMDTICRVLDWMRQNMVHFQQGPNLLGGDDTFGGNFAVWQYAGYPPLSKIVTGTVDKNNANMGIQHWTAGCHGSVGFLNAVLRVVNIPVQPVWVCGHELAYFMTERLYMDHGDDPYNLTVKNSSQPIWKVLIDEATYKSRFSNDLKVNITDPQAMANVGLSAYKFPP